MTGTTRQAGRSNREHARLVTRQARSRRPMAWQAAAVARGRRRLGSVVRQPMATGALQQGLEEAPPSRARRAVALGLILVSSFMTVLDFSIVNVALPSIQRQLGFSSTSPCSLHESPPPVHTQCTCG